MTIIEIGNRLSLFYTPENKPVSIRQYGRILGKILSALGYAVEIAHCKEPTRYLNTKSLAKNATEIKNYITANKLERPFEYINTIYKIALFAAKKFPTKTSTLPDSETDSETDSNRLDDPSYKEIDLEEQACD